MMFGKLMMISEDRKHMMGSRFWETENGKQRMDIRG